MMASIKLSIDRSVDYIIDGRIDLTTVGGFVLTVVVCVALLQGSESNDLRVLLPGGSGREREEGL